MFNFNKLQMLLLYFLTELGHLNVLKYFFHLRDMILVTPEGS